MYLKESYTSFLQRIAAFFCIMLSPGQEVPSIPGIPEKSFSHLHKFFTDFYKLLFEKPEDILLNDVPDICLMNDEHKSKNQAYKKAEGAVKPLIVDFINFLYNAGQTGSLRDNSLIVDLNIYEKYIKSKKREKIVFIGGLAPLGFHISVEYGHVELTCKKYPEMFQALTVFAARCAGNVNKLGWLHFITCNFKALDMAYIPDAGDYIDRIIENDGESAYLMDIHDELKAKDYAITFKLEGDVALEIYYTNKKVKSSPLLGILLDIRFFEPVSVSMRFVSTSRLTPIAGTLSDEMQEAFFQDTGYCGGANCGWCKNQKGLLRPSLLTVKDKHKTICWYAQKSYTNVKEKELNKILNYIRFHEQLARPC